MPCIKVKVKAICWAIQVTKETTHENLFVIIDCKDVKILYSQVMIIDGRQSTG
ncbi:hypothetical protein GIB67_021142, partial [Kingdonia uniflora]